MKLDDYISRERGFTLIKCRYCGEFFDKYVRHVCCEKNSMPLNSRLITEDKNDDN